MPLRSVTRYDRLAWHLHPAFSSASPSSTTILRRSLALLDAISRSVGMEESDQQPYQLKKTCRHSGHTTKLRKKRREGWVALARHRLHGQNQNAVGSSSTTHCELD
ncbi:hypothetical protein VNO80_17166 [Phaseolus coccineus]|uniref:Uncharacterized protein n=1 Tax=Phaseolus coccineus TaxID=3886 RepID=A0AAN9MNG0_PHACN